MNLKGDAAFTRSDLLIIQVYHFLSVQPSLYVVALYFDTHRVPIAFFQDILFLIRNLNQPATSVRLIDTTCIVALRSYFYLPAVYFHAFLYERADEYAGVSVSLLLKLYGQIKIIIIITGSELTVLLVGTTFANQ